MNDKRQQIHPKGVTLLLVMIILSIVSSIALGVTLLILRQFEQGVDVRSALKAQSAADSGIEQILHDANISKTGTPAEYIADLIAAYGCDSHEFSVGDSTFCVDNARTFEYEDEVRTSLLENQTITVDVFDPDTATQDEVTAVKITGDADADTWLEVTWVAWDASSGSFNFISSATKQLIDPSTLASSAGATVYLKKSQAADGSLDIYYLQDPNGLGNCSAGFTADPIDDVKGCYCRMDKTWFDSLDPVTEQPEYEHCVFKEESGGALVSSNVQYVMRVKALYGNANEVHLTSHANCFEESSCDNGSQLNIPTRIAVKVVGENNSVQQFVEMSFPWKLSLAGLFDYVLLSQEKLEKTTTITQGFFSTGTIEAEFGLTHSGINSPGDYTVKSAWALFDNIVKWDYRFTCGTAVGCLANGWGDSTGGMVSTYAGATDNVTCEIDPLIGASGDATCRFIPTLSAGVIQPASIRYKLESLDIPSSEGQYSSYYLNYRVRVNSKSTKEKMFVRRCSNDTTCGSYSSATFSETSQPWNSKDGWVSCSAAISLLPTDQLEFRANDVTDDWKDAYGRTVESSPRLDSWSISSVQLYPTCVFEQLAGSSGLLGPQEFTYNIIDYVDAGDSCTNTTTCDTAFDTKWLAHDRVYTTNSSALMHCNDAAYTETFFNVTAANICSLRTSVVVNPSYFGILFALREQGSLWSTIPEGTYYLTLYHKGYRKANSTSNVTFDFASFDTAGNNSADYQATQRQRTDLMWSQDYPLAGGGTDACYIKRPFVVRSGDLMRLDIAHQDNVMNLESIRLSKYLPEDVDHTCPICGDGVIDTSNIPMQGLETCDEGDLNGVSGHCNSTCTGVLP